MPRKARRRFQVFLWGQILKFAGDNQEHIIREAIEHVADTFDLTDQDRKEVLPSGSQYIIGNRVGWSRTYLKKAGLLESPKRSYFKITPLGLGVLKKNPSEINVKFLEQFPLFIEFRNTKKEKDENEEHEVETGSTQTPQELLEYGYQKLRKDLSNKIKSR